MLPSLPALRSPFKVSWTSPIETSFIEVISEHSGKSRAVVGEAGRRGIRELGADRERTGDITHLATSHSVSLFIRFVNCYFRFVSPTLFVPFVFTRVSLDTMVLSIPHCQLPLFGMRGILCVRGNRTFHDCGVQTRSASASGISAYCWLASAFLRPNSASAEEAARKSSRPSIDPLPYLYSGLWQQSKLES